MGVYSTSFAKSYTTNCFQEHIQESIAINKERKREYSLITDGASDKIFTHLIAMEHLTIPVAFYYDQKAKPFQKKGLDLFCHEFMSMNKVSTFNPDKRVIPTHDFPELSLSQYKKDIKKTLEEDDIERLKALSLSELDKLSKYPQYYCMTRHIIESIYRFAFFIDIREREASALKIESPKDLMKKVIKTHLLGVDDSLKIDRWSQPIQEKGVSLLCSELPDLMFDLKDK